MAVLQDLSQIFRLLLEFMAVLLQSLFEFWLAVIRYDHDKQPSKVGMVDT